MGSCLRWRLYRGTARSALTPQNARAPMDSAATIGGGSRAQNALDIHVAREQAARLPFEHVSPIVRVRAVVEAHAVRATPAAAAEIGRPRTTVAKDVQPRSETDVQYGARGSKRMGTRTRAKTKLPARDLRICLPELCTYARTRSPWAQCLPGSPRSASTLRPSPPATAATSASSTPAPACRR